MIPTIVTKHDPNGCFQRALDDEPVFTLLGRDPGAPMLIRKWATDRENKDAPPQYYGEPTNPHPDQDRIDQARYVAARMEAWRFENDGRWRETDEEA